MIAALLALACCGTALAAASASTSPVATESKLAGKWKGHYGGAVSGNFTIHWKQSGSLLHGNIKLSNPSGTYALDGSVRHGKIKFGAVTVGARYKGTLQRNEDVGNLDERRGRRQLERSQSVLTS